VLALATRPRKKRGSEPTRQLTVHLPQSALIAMRALAEHLDCSWSEACSLALVEAAKSRGLSLSTYTPPPVKPEPFSGVAKSEKSITL
jgi:hypothetical protein